MAPGTLARTVGDRARAHRLSRGLGQDAYAELLDVHRSPMSHVERGTGNLTLRTVEDLARRMDVHPLDLLAEPGWCPRRAEGPVRWRPGPLTTSELRGGGARLAVARLQLAGPVGGGHHLGPKAFASRSGASWRDGCSDAEGATPLRRSRPHLVAAASRAAGELLATESLVELLHPSA